MYEVPVSASEPIAASAVVPMASVTSAAATTLEIVQATSAPVSIHLWPSCRQHWHNHSIVVFDQTALPVARLEENRNRSPSSPEVIAQVEQDHSVSHLRPCILPAFTDDQ